MYRVISEKKRKDFEEALNEAAEEGYVLAALSCEADYVAVMEFDEDEDECEECEEDEEEDEEA